MRIRPGAPYPLGATVVGSTVEFSVWAPSARSVDVVFETRASEVGAALLTPSTGGFFSAVVPGLGAGDRYRFRLDGQGPFPDPASRFQPSGVHGPSEIVDWRTYRWGDEGWTGLPLEATILYELHVGTFTPEGTFAAAAARLPALADLGVTAIELMPVAAFAGRWNWGYDGVAPFAPAHQYGAPDDLRRFVDEAHQLGMAVYLDVVYNHLGPDGAWQFTFSPRYASPSHESLWGAAINFDGPDNGPVRDYFVESAVRWVLEYHIDGLRLDATHAIVDDSRPHVVAAIAEAVHGAARGAGRQAQVIAEDTRNLAHMLVPAPDGWGLDGVWSDDFHHHVRRALAGDCDGYFLDFDGSAAGIARTACLGWAYTGQFAPYFGEPRGTDPTGIPLSRFVFFVQNHDQVGNRAFGDRLHHLIDVAGWRAVSVLLLLLPETPLLFMGQEWAASTPFRYFTDHAEALGRLVTEGRRREFSRFRAFADPEARERIPDPQDPATFRASRIDWDERQREPHASVFRLYRRLISLRREWPVSAAVSGRHEVATAVGDEAVVVCRTRADGDRLVAVVRLRGAGPVAAGAVPLARPPSGRRWESVLTTEDEAFATDPAPAEFDAADARVDFARPGAVVFRAVAESRLRRDQ